MRNLLNLTYLINNRDAKLLKKWIKCAEIVPLEYDDYDSPLLIKMENFKWELAHKFKRDKKIKIKMLAIIDSFRKRMRLKVKLSIKENIDNDFDFLDLDYDNWGIFKEYKYNY